MPFPNFREDKTLVSLNTAENTQQILRHLYLLNQKIIDTFDLHLAQSNTPSKYARNAKWESIESMAKLLELFEEKWSSFGSSDKNKLYWANDASDAEKIINKIIISSQAKTALNIAGTEITEFDIVNILKKHKVNALWANWEKALQVFLDENEQHPLFPLIHRSQEQLNNALEMQNTNEGSTLEYWIAEHHTNINNLSSAETIAFMPAEFLCPDLGAVCWFDEKGIYGKTLQKANTIVILAGIDRIINSSNSLDVVAGMLNALNKGEYLPPNLHYVMTNVKANQSISIILVDNARTSLLEDRRWRNILLDLDGFSWLNQCHDFPYINPQENYHPLHFGPVSALLGHLLYPPEDFVSKHIFWADLQDSFLPHPYLLNYRKLLISLRQQNYEDNKNRPTTIHDLWQEYPKAFNDKLGLKKWQLSRKVQKVLGKNRKVPKLANESFMSVWQKKVNQSKKI